MEGTVGHILYVWLFYLWVLSGGIVQNVACRPFQIKYIQRPQCLQVTPGTWESPSSALMWILKHVILSNAAAISLLSLTYSAANSEQSLLSLQPLVICILWRNILLFLASHSTLAEGQFYYLSGVWSTYEILTCSLWHACWWWTWGVHIFGHMHMNLSQHCSVLLLSCN